MIPVTCSPHLHNQATKSTLSDVAIPGSLSCCDGVQEYLLKLVNTLAQFPPPQPTQPAVDLLVTVGQQQEYFSWHNLLPPTGHPGSLDVLKVGQQLASQHLSLLIRHCTCQHFCRLCSSGVMAARSGCTVLVTSWLHPYMECAWLAKRLGAASVRPV